MGGIEALVNAISTKGQKKEVLEPAVGALRNLIQNHSQSEEALRTMLNLNFLPILLQHLKMTTQTRPHPHWPSMKSMINLIKSLLLRRSINTNLFRDVGCIAHIRELLKYIVSELIVNSFF